ncbi:MAG: LysE family translocator [Acidimicrobiales bacterium]
MSTTTLLAFAAAALLLLVIPGPAVMYIVTRSAAQGRKAGLVSVAGIHLGTVVHIVAAMIGLSAILAASATAFTVVKLVGAAYLIWLGLQSIRSYQRGKVETDVSVAPRRLRRVFVDAVVLNVLNPKTAIFFLSFVPQFIDPETAHPVLDIATLGAVFIVLGLVSDGAYASPVDGSAAGSAAHHGSNVVKISSPEAPISDWVPSPPSPAAIRAELPPTVVDPGQ